MFLPADIIYADFPFIDLPESKKRPMLVLSPAEFTQRQNAVTVAMISSSLQMNWLYDTWLTDWQQVGLKRPSFIRAKLFTLTSGQIITKFGQLKENDWRAVQVNLRLALSL